MRPAAKSPIAAKGVARADFRTFDGLDLALRLATEGKANWVTLSAKGTGKAAPESAAIEKRVKGWVYRIPAYTAGLLKASAASLVLPAQPKS